MKPIKIESKNLIYEPLSIKHLSNKYVSWLNNIDVYKYLESGGDYNINKLEKYITTLEKDILFWAILTKKTNKHIGNIKIDPVDLKSKNAEYGILIGDTEEWGKGYGFEASNTIISYCFNNLKLKTIQLGVKKENINAIKLYKKLGFIFFNDKISSKNLISYRMIKKNEQ